MSRSDPDLGATEQVERAPLHPAHPHLELQITCQALREYRVPFLKNSVRLAEEVAPAFPNGTPWVATVEGEKVILHQEKSGTQLYLSVGETVELDESQILLCDVRQPSLGTLESLDRSLDGRRWHLKWEKTWLGRRGKRLNHIEIDNPTISRTHVTFFPGDRGQPFVLCETSASTTVNGEVLGLGARRRLNHGDLLGLGGLSFRFRGNSQTEESDSLVLKTLGGFRLSGATAKMIEIRNPKSRWLFARLAVNWGDLLAVESLLADFWPEATTTRARKNLSYTISQLREAFGDTGIEFDSLLLRTPSTLGLSLEEPVYHDYLEVSGLTRQRKALCSPESLQTLLGAYGGQFLPSCYQGWAESLRAELDRNFTESLLATAEQALVQKAYGMLYPAVERLLALDELNERAVGLAMEAALAQEQPERAVSAYQSLAEALAREGLLPSPPLARLYQRASRRAL